MKHDATKYAPLSYVKKIVSLQRSIQTPALCIPL
uniref:Uncharacterized protein n=1 Tax=Arundo donax TaxID=35708 RepID=A0A0A9DI10_ARUDO